MRCPRLALLAAGLALPFLAQASEVNLSSAIHPVPITLSGTLSPFAIAINGKDLHAVGQPATELLLNGSEVPHTSDESRAFYLKTELNAFKIEVVYEDGHKATLASFAQPSVAHLELRRGSLRTKLAGPYKAVTFDGENVAIENGQGEISHSPEEEWFQRPHVLEIEGTAGQGRLYNLNLSNSRSQALADLRVGAGWMDSNSGSGQGWGVTFGKMWSSGWGGDLCLIYVDVTHDDGSAANPGASDRTTGESVMIHGWRSLFLTGDSWLDLRRVYGGVHFAAASVKQTSHQPTSTSGDYTSTRSETVAGPSFRFEPVLIAGFGISIGTDFHMIRAHSYGSMGGQILLNYHW